VLTPKRRDRDDAASYSVVPTGRAFKLNSIDECIYSGVTRDGDGTYKSTDHGTTFTKVSTHFGIVNVKSDSDSVVRVLDINREELSDGHRDVFESTNSGSTWTLKTTAASFVVNLAAQFDEEVFAFGCPHRRNEKLLFWRIDETCAPHAGV
jgi:hypothetical protein